MRSHYIEYMDISSNLRVKLFFNFFIQARCYKLAAIPKYKIETTAFEVDRTCPFIKTITSSAACFEIYTLLYKKGRQFHRNLNADMGINSYINNIPDDVDKENDEIDVNVVKIP